jgi:hypothetical protein
MMQVFFDRGFRNAEDLRNLGIGHSLHQQINGPPLTAGQRRFWLAT